eukprot:908662-Pleurochrysis_carterae.AAC.2
MSRLSIRTLVERPGTMRALHQRSATTPGYSVGKAGRGYGALKEEEEENIQEKLCALRERAADISMLQLRVGDVVAAAGATVASASASSSIQLEVAVSAKSAKV